jgi:hypothetical protein
VAAFGAARRARILAAAASSSGPIPKKSGGGAVGGVVGGAVGGAAAGAGTAILQVSNLRHVLDILPHFFNDIVETKKKDQRLCRTHVCLEVVFSSEGKFKKRLLTSGSDRKGHLMTSFGSLLIRSHLSPLLCPVGLLFVRNWLGVSLFLFIKVSYWSPLVP